MIYEAGKLIQVPGKAPACLEFRKVSFCLPLEVHDTIGPDRSQPVHAGDPHSEAPVNQVVAKFRKMSVSWQAAPRSRH